MPYSEVYYDQNNIVSGLSADERQRQAQRTSQNWQGATDDLRNLIEDSKQGWDHYLHNRPSSDQLANVGKTDKLDSANRNASRQGLRFGGIPKAVDSILSILHSQIFPPDERFFRGTPQNSVARDHQELYEQHRQNNFAEDNATEKLRLLLLTACIDPAAACAVTWRKTTKRNVTYEPKVKLVLGGIELPLPVFGLKKKVEEDYVEWEGTCVEPLDFNDWRVDTTARCMDESWFIRRRYMPCWQVEREFGIKNVKPYSQAFNEIAADPQGNQKSE